MTYTHEKFVPKRWGYEKWIVNNDKYCGKVLFIAAGESFSYHYHQEKHETFHILSGEGIIHIGKNALITWEEMNSVHNYTEDSVYELNPGKSLQIKPYIPHKILAKTDLTLIEFSTTHSDADSFRLETIVEKSPIEGEKFRAPEKLRTPTTVFKMNVGEYAIPPVRII